MDPVTHVFGSIVLARAVRRRLPRSGVAIVVTAGVIADLDSFSYFAGAAAFLRFDHALLHSLFSSLILTAVIAAGFVMLDRKRIRTVAEESPIPLRFAPALAASAVAIAFHLLLDASSGTGLQLFWPFRIHWTSWAFTPYFDIWVLLIFAATLAVPELIDMVSEEIGEHHTTRRGILAAQIGLVVLVFFVGACGMLRFRAEALLASRDYDGHAALAVGAFPTASPLTWRGIVSTETALDELEISFLPGQPFDPTRSVSHNKPDASPVLDAAEATPAAKTFLSYARFPLASVVPTDAGTDVRLRDLRFPSNDKSPENLGLTVEVSAAGAPTFESIFFDYRGYAARE